MATKNVDVRPLRSWLISAVENEKFVLKQRDSEADAVILELEAGAYDKNLAREQAAKALRDLDYGDKYRVLRINSLSGSEGRLDLDATLDTPPDAVMLTKIRTAEQVSEADEVISEVERQKGLQPRSIELAIMMESSECIFEVREIARASDRTRALCFGPGDYTADIRGRFTHGTTYPAGPGFEILVARSLVVAGCRAAGVSPIDGPMTGSVKDHHSNIQHGWQSRALGFDGMIVLSPSQIRGVHEAFTPTDHEIAHAKHILERFEAGKNAGQGVVGSQDGEMISETIAEIYADVLRRADV